MARSMAPLYDGHDYYKRMLELQEKLRKSEEERIRLEERFNMLVRESRNRHDVCINRLRMRYIEYLEEQRTKDERNHKLLAALDKVMNKLALISAKKDRLNVLRKQYEAYLLRAYANYRPPGSITGDSGIASQNEEKNTKKTTMIHPDLTSTEMKRISSPRMYSEAPDHQSNQPRSTSPSKFHEQINISLKNPPISATTLNVDHRRTNVPSGSHVYVPISNQYSQIPSSVPNNLQHVPDVRVSYAEAPALSMASSDNVQPHIAPVNRFFREHVESAQAVSGFPTTARYPIGDTTRYEETSRHQFDPLLQYRDANVLTSDSGRKEYDSAAVGPTLVTGKSSTYRIGSDTNVANQIGPLPGYMDYVLTSSQRSDDERSSRSITSDDLDGLIRRNERLLWSKADIAATSRGSPEGDVNFDENGMTAIVEDELDRYISNIRKLHREHGVQNLEEQDHEQNTSGDLLNVSLSEDPLEPSAENRARKERVSEEMNKVLALANDLASRTNPEEILRDSKRNNSFTEDKIESCETKNDASRSKDERKAEEYVTSVKNEIKNDVAASLTKSELPHIDTQIMKENQDNVDDSADRKISATKKDNINEAMNESRNELKEKFDLAIGEESNIENVFEAAEELAPWDIASVQKKVCELRLDDSEEDQAAEKCAEDRINEEISNGLCNSLRSTEQNEADGEVENASSSETKVLPHLETEAKTIDTSEASEEQNKIHESKHEDAENESLKVLSQNSANESEIAAQSGEQLIEADGNERRKQANDEDTEARVDDQSGDLIKDSEYNVEQGYVEDPSQAQQYEQQDLNQQYYDQNMPYEAGNEEYQRYADQGYAQEGQEYVEYVDSQYEQYPEDVNNQQYQHYSNEQYEQDPNQTYDYNYDPNQGYEDSGRQYDPNQGYENHPETQAYEYTEEVSYEPNQTYEQEYKEKQRDPEDDTAKKPETEEVSRKQADQDLNQKSNEDKSQQDVVNEVNQSRKKDVIKSLLDSDTDTTIERNVSNTESDFDFN